MKSTGKDFEERKEELLQEAKKLGIVDVSTASPNGITPETLDLAIKLTRKHGATLYQKIEERRKAQE